MLQGSRCWKAATLHTCPAPCCCYAAHSKMLLLLGCRGSNNSWALATPRLLAAVKARSPARLAERSPNHCPHRATKFAALPAWAPAEQNYFLAQTIASKRSL